MERIQVAQPMVGEEEVSAVGKVLLSGNYVSGAQVEEFEDAFAEYTGTSYAVATATGTAALHLSLASLGIGPGDEVIVPPLTFFSTVTSVLHQHATPVFADVDPATFCLDPSSVKHKITERTKAVIPVHLFGQPCNMEALVSLAEAEDLYIIEDCAQAHGARYRGRPVGTMGKAGCFSFYATKNMTTGEGGIITTDDEEIAERCRLLRSHGMSDRHTHVRLGYNYRMTEMEAAMGKIQLSKLDHLNEDRTEKSEWLLEELSSVEWLRRQDYPTSTKHSFFWCAVWVDEQKLGMGTDELVDYLDDRGIEVRYRYTDPLYRQPLLRKQCDYPFNCEGFKITQDYEALRLDGAEKVAGRVIGLPNHYRLESEEMNYIVRVFEGL